MTLNLKQLRELEARATKGPWYGLLDDANGVAQANTQEWICHGCYEHDQKFIAESRNQLKPLLDLVDELEEALKFYAEPCSWFAVSVLCDPPCGDIKDDFYIDGEGSPRIGKRAKAALQKLDKAKRGEA